MRRWLILRLSNVHDSGCCLSMHAQQYGCMLSYHACTAVCVHAVLLCMYLQPVCLLSSHAQSAAWVHAVTSCMHCNMGVFCDPSCHVLLSHCLAAALNVLNQRLGFPSKLLASSAGSYGVEATGARQKRVGSWRGVMQT